MRWWGLVVAGMLVLAERGAGSAGFTDPADTALNIIPSGQYGDAPPPPGPLPRRRCTTVSPRCSIR